MFYIKIAEITVAIDNTFEYVRRLCEKYIVEPIDNPNITVKVSVDEIKKEVSMAEVSVTPAYAEGVCVYRAICKLLPKQFGAFLMHSAVIEYEGEGYAFAAHSGVGKSTHISLWQSRFGDSVRIINGDKPILKFKGERLYAYGTPWCGKEGYNINAAVPLKAICFIERAEKNSIRKITPSEALVRVFHQLLPPETAETVDTLFPLLDRMLTEIPCYILGCNISEEAAEVAYKGMNDKGDKT